jgi:acyl-CoA reductase-like NAD-dependent aldehyde dehydrogenase
MSARSDADRIEDVKRIVAAAREVVRDRAEIADDVATATGLSREGVELAFTRHVEIDPSDSEIASLVAASGSAKHVAVILSANVFVAALRAIAIARAASASVIVRPSRREPHFARALVEHARAAGDLGLRVIDELDVASIFGGEIHVYGRDATIASVRARAGDRVRVRGHGAGMGLAVVTSSASIDDAARALAEDVIAFDQRGCLSPRAALVLGDDARASAFADALHAALAAAALRVPRGALADDEREAAARYAATIAYAGRLLDAPSHLVGVAHTGAPLLVPPSGRHVHVAAVADLAALRALVAPLASVVIAVGSDDPALAAAIAPAHARVSPLGAMQRPPLDGAVDRRTR